MNEEIKIKIEKNMTYHFDTTTFDLNKAFTINYFCVSIVQHFCDMLVNIKMEQSSMLSLSIFIVE